MEFMEFGNLTKFAVLGVALALIGCSRNAQSNVQAKSAQAKSAQAKDRIVGSTSKGIGLRENAAVITKEPSYQSSPMYALLVFGEDAKKQHWLVVDNRTVYLDRNGNGDLTDAEDRVSLDEKATAEINMAEGGEYSGFDVFDLGELSGHSFTYNVWVLNKDFVAPTNENSMLTEWRKERLDNGWMNSTLYRLVGSKGQGVQIPVTLCSKPELAQIMHIDGPLTFGLKFGDRQQLTRNDNLFDVNIGTLGESPVNRKEPTYTNLSTAEVPSDLHPIANFQFAAKNGDPIAVSVELDQRC